MGKRGRLGWSGDLVLQGLRHHVDERRLDCSANDRGEAIHDPRRHASSDQVGLSEQEPHEVLGWRAQEVAHQAGDFAGEDQLLCEIVNRCRVVPLLREAPQGVGLSIGEGEDVEAVERQRVHHVGRLQVGEEPVLDTVGEEGQLHRRGGVEVARQLAAVGVERDVSGLALDEDGELTSQVDRVVDLLCGPALSLLDEIGHELGLDLGGIVDVEPQHLEERQDQRLLGRLLTTHVGAALLQLFAELSNVLE